MQCSHLAAVLRYDLFDQFTGAGAFDECTKFVKPSLICTIGANKHVRLHHLQIRFLCWLSNGVWGCTVFQLISMHVMREDYTEAEQLRTDACNHKSPLIAPVAARGPHLTIIDACIKGVGRPISCKLLSFVTFC
jgi:hypothetical protein